MELEERDRFVRELAGALTMSTGDVWAPVIGEGVFAYLDGQDGRRINMHFSWNEKRVEFSGGYPRSPHSSEEFGLGYGETHRVGCSVERGAVAVAKDVARRFLPHYEEVWQDGLERLRLHLEKVEETKQALTCLEEAWDAEGKWHETSPHAGSLRLYSTDGLWADVSLAVYDRGPVVDVDLHSLPVEYAVQVGLLLREMTDAERRVIGKEEENS